MQRDYYQVLGVAREASPAAIRTAYARLARRHHPDVVGELPSRLADVQQAYRCLSDPEARARHDRTIAEVERAHADRQRRVQQRLHGYDRRHPRVPPSPGSRWRWRRLAMVVAGAALVAELSLRLLG